ncbi:MAG: FAD/NAD(P)-binding protein [Candidatus Omnitrophica bacterium]|nr:FAD/NAD(P)-binding protein [Candidatus Omnitrophota bacterium]MBU1913561.1 FAD/NAD(P)-binding protein [Candidatus Omnitrophota bacterium]
MKNEYIPYPAIIEAIQTESFDTRTLKVRFKDKRLRDSFDYKPGQFVEISVLGAGEAPISITSSPSRKGFLEFTVRAVGKVTKAIHKLKVGDTVYLRGPYGNSFPFEEAKNRNLLFVAGGIGLPPLRSVINMAFDNRDDFGNIKILYGAKAPDELCFKEELKIWQGIPQAEVLLTVDKPANGWKGNIGVVTTLWKKTEISPKDAIAYVCGPPIMIKFVLQKLLESGFKPDNIYVSLERYMKCGIGKCGHCNIGDKFACIDGPVFSFGQIKELPDKEREI